jgi:protein-disulfide isomerase
LLPFTVLADSAADAANAADLASFDHLKPLPPTLANQLYNPAGNTVAGNPNGSLTLVEFFDYNCPHCRAFRPALEKLIAKNPQLRVVYKEYLLFGDSSIPATQAALAASQQGKYLALHSALLQATKPLQRDEILRIAQTVGLDTQKLAKDMQSPAVAQQIQANNTLVDTIGIEGAPTFIIANSNITKNPSQPNNKQYVFVGDDNAAPALQKMIDAVKSQ